MKLEGLLEIDAPRARVWALVTDPAVLAPCLPAVQSIEKLDGGRFTAQARVGIGFINAKVVVDAEFTEIHEPNDATVLARGHAPGSAVDATVRIVLTDGANGSTALAWTADVTVSGIIASVGTPQIDGAARKLVGQALGCIKATLEA
jgi:carbon monoxide dehydrogenase subunit G